MTNDSVTVALMRKMELTDIATFDRDLDRVSHLRVYQPGEIPLKAAVALALILWVSIVAMVFADHNYPSISSSSCSSSRPK